VFGIENLFYGNTFGRTNPGLLALALQGLQRRISLTSLL